jgi:primosomal protein N' (replication factor Y) (superfamily II helicase)
MYSRVIVDLAIDQPLDYAVESELRPVPGALCVVPVARRDRVGICVGVSGTTAVPSDKLRTISHVSTEVAPLSADWLELTRFAAEYYQHAWGEVAIPALPPLLRQPPGPRFGSVVARLRRMSVEAAHQKPETGFALNAGQLAAVEAIGTRSGFAPVLLFGVTGSGKTAVYLESIARTLVRDPTAQCLLLVPEINLTPQLLTQVNAYFPQVSVVSMHSGMGDRERTAAWLSAHEGRAQIVIGTRLAVLASLPRIALIIVDEEHDTSYKAGDGVRLSARDLAIKRAQINSVAVILGSATPSLETWAHAQSGRYQLLRLTQRAREAAVPSIELVEIQAPIPATGVSAALGAALGQAIDQGEQALVFINRRGYAPVFACAACGWVSQCERCSVFAAYHKSDSTLRCHHCGWQVRVPRKCPTCGNQDLDAVGQGTQRIEEGLKQLFPNARIDRIDRDSTRRRGAAETAFGAVHSGATDILVGTQMIAKGHDFQRVALVGVLNTDSQLKSPDFRAPERLFATLMQVAGRAGRAEGQSSRVMVQTRYPAHPLLGAFVRQDYEGFANHQLAERRAAGMPPYAYQALLTTEGRSMDAALGFLATARDLALKSAVRARIYEPVPMPIAKVGGKHRAQLLVESARRRALHGFLQGWLTAVKEAARQHTPRVRYRIEVDPQEI